MGVGWNLSRRLVHAMPAYKVRTSECRVGVVGMHSSGRTVFLTSLIDHLQNQDSGSFHLGADGKAFICKFRALPVDRGWERFNYHGHRDRIAKALGWPAKTTDRSQYVCEFERSDWHVSKAKLKLYDLPGERIA